MHHPSGRCRCHLSTYDDTDPRGQLDRPNLVKDHRHVRGAVGDDRNDVGLAGPWSSARAAYEAGHRHDVRIDSVSRADDRRGRLRVRFAIALVERHGHHCCRCT